MTDRISQELRHAIGSISTKSVLNPILWLCGLVLIPCFILATLANGLLQLFFVIVGIVPLALAAFLIFKYSDRPELFQSEEFRLKDQALRVYGDSNRPNHDTLPAIIHPRLLTSDDVKALTDQREI